MPDWLRNTVTSGSVYALWRPTASSASPTVAVAVALDRNHRCSTRCARPSLPGGSSAEPASTTVTTAVTGARPSRRATTRRPLAAQ